MGGNYQFYAEKLPVNSIIAIPAEAGMAKKMRPPNRGAHFMSSYYFILAQKRHSLPAPIIPELP